jgi:hypothetical protein
MTLTKYKIKRVTDKRDIISANNLSLMLLCLPPVYYEVRTYYSSYVFGLSYTNRAALFEILHFIQLYSVLMK